MKREPMGNEREQDSWLGTTLRQTPATASEACLDAETLAAWADGGLSAKAAAAVELHASNCSRCTAVLAAMERSAPAASVDARVDAGARVPMARAVDGGRDRRRHLDCGAGSADYPGGTSRPLTIWRFERQNAPESAEPGTRNLERTRGTLRARTGNPAEPGTPNQNPAPSTQNPEPQSQKPRRARSSVRDARRDCRRDARAARARGAQALSAAATPRRRRRRAAAPAAPHTRACGAIDTCAQQTAPSVTATTRSAFSSAAMATESVSPSNPLIRLADRCVCVGRALDRRRQDVDEDHPPPGAASNNRRVTVVGIRAVDGDRAVARTSDGAEFYTTNGGRSWTRVQENSAAPF